MFQPGESGNINGRPVGALSKFNAEIRDMVRQALEDAGGVSYLVRQAKDNPVAFMGLIAKIIPADVNIKIKEMPSANVYPMGKPEVTIENEQQPRLPTPSEAMDSLH